MGNSTDNKVVHGYWGIRGNGQNSRLLLAYCGADWEDVKYVGPEQWFGKDKQELGLDFPNLPYLIDGDLKLTETSALLKYIPKRFNKPELLGKNLKDEAVVENILGVFQEIRTAIMGLFMDKEWKGKLEGTLTKVQPKIELIRKFYGEKKFALGYLTVVDFVIAEFSHYLQKIAPEVYAKNGFFKRTREALENLPEIKKYYQQESAVKGPFLPPIATLSF